MSIISVSVATGLRLQPAPAPQPEIGTSPRRKLQRSGLQGGLFPRDVIFMETRLFPTQRRENINHATQGSGQQQRIRRVCVCVCARMKAREQGSKRVRGSERETPTDSQRKKESERKGLSLYLCARACVREETGRLCEGKERAWSGRPATSERLHGNAAI